MISWSAEVTNLDKMCNKYIKGSFKIRPIEDYLEETRLRWHSHVMRRPIGHMTKKNLEIETI